jgi:hypothetical protein
MGTQRNRPSSAAKSNDVQLAAPTANGTILRGAGISFVANCKSGCFGNLIMNSIVGYYQ